MDGYCNSLIDGNALGQLRFQSQFQFDCNSLMDGNALGPERATYDPHGKL